MKKYIGAVIKEVRDESKRIIRARISDETLDRDREIIRLSAWDMSQLDEFIENSAALLLSHAYQTLPIGKILNFTKAGSDTKSPGLYMDAKILKDTVAADEAWEVISQIGKIGFSVGFVPKGYRNLKVSQLTEREKASCLKVGLGSMDTVKVFIDVELFEVSLVSVPSLPTATLISYKAGKLKNGALQKACRDIITHDKKPLNPAEKLHAEVNKINESLKELKQIQKERLKVAAREIAIESQIRRMFSTKDAKMVLKKAIEVSLEKLKEEPECQSICDPEYLKTIKDPLKLAIFELYKAAGKISADPDDAFSWAARKWPRLRSKLMPESKPRVESGIVSRKEVDEIKDLLLKNTKTLRG